MKRRAWAAVGLVFGGLVALNALLVVLDRLTPEPSGPESSSYATAPGGLAAYADLLRRAGHPVRRLRESPADVVLDPAATVVVLDPDNPDEADVVALRRFVAGGGRLLVGGAIPAAWLDELVGDEPDWSGRPLRRSTPRAPVAEVAGVEVVRAAGPGSWTDTGEALPVLGERSRTLLAVGFAGRGRFVLLADASPLQNRLLAGADNAALGLVLAGPPERPVVFVEGVHGFKPASGIRAIPDNWLAALGGLVLAALVFMVARGRRLGPPELESRELPPPRREYVESLAALLARTRRPVEAAEPVHVEARARIARRAGLAADADDAELREAGRRLGLDELELAAVFGRGDDVLSAGRALARLGEARR